MAVMPIMETPVPIPDVPLPGLPASMEQWLAFFAAKDLPVLRHTAQAFERMAHDIDEMDARTIAEHVLEDPMMTLKVFAWSSTMRSRRQTTDLETIEPVILMTGVNPFFRQFQQLPTIEQALIRNPRALAGVLRVVSRAYRASAYARDWALRRRDLDTEVILIAALLHDFAEILMWVYAPEVALALQARQQADRTLRSADLQREMFGVELADLQIALVRQWHLPELLVTLLDDHHASHPRVRNVLFAVNLARHSSRGWDDAALDDDFSDIAELLHLTPGHVREMLMPEQMSGASR